MKLTKRLMICGEALRDSSRKDVKQLARTSFMQKLIEPISLFHLLETPEHLLISPDGKLNLFPFEALVDQQNHYLVENFLCSYLTSGRDLLRLQIPRDNRNRCLFCGKSNVWRTQFMIAKDPDWGKI